MALRSGIFNSVNGDRKYNAENFAEYFATFIGNGVFPNPSDNFKVVPNSGMTVNLSVGKAWVNGYYVFNDNIYSMQLDVADGIQNRIDRIVLQLNFVNREIVPVIKKGDFSSTPVAPEVTRNDDVYELSLATIYVAAGALSVNESNITDTRLDESVCGLVKSTITGTVEWMQQEVEDAVAYIDAEVSRLNQDFTTLQNNTIPSSQRGTANGIATTDGNNQVAPIHVVNIQDQLNRLGYDIYNLMMENYYFGNSTVSPSFGAARSLVFDPMKDANTYNSSSSTAQLVNQKIVCNISSISEQIPNSASEYSFNGFTKSVDVESGASETLSGSASQLVDGSTSTGYGLYTGSYEFDIEIPVRLDLGSSKVITGFRGYGSGYRSWAYCNFYRRNSDGTYTSLGNFDVSANGGTWRDLNLSTSSHFHDRYIYVRISLSSNNSSSQSAYVRELRVYTASYVSSTYRSKTFNLEFTPTKARMYISYKKPTGTNISPSLLCGTTYKTGAIIGSRTDPNFSGFTEYIYEYDLTGLSKPTEVKIDLTPSATYGTPEVKRYGVYFY